MKNLKVELDGTHTAEVTLRVKVRTQPEVRLIEDGGLHLAPPLRGRWLDDGTGRECFDEQAVAARVAAQLARITDSEVSLWGVESVEVVEP